MKILCTQKKLREARFFYAKMSERASMAFGEHEEFDFYLSAFLSAARSVTFVLQKEQPDEYKTFFDQWYEKLATDKQRLLKFMNDERVSEVHKTGSTRDQRDEPIPIWNSYQDKSGRVEVTAPPGLSEPPATVLKPAYFFEIDGTDRDVISVSQKYLDLLESFIEDFCKTTDVA